MIIWKKKTNLTELNKQLNDNMMSYIGIKITKIGKNYLEGTMPCNNKTKQPFGILHGGASVTLAESLGSMAANLCLNDEYYAVGLEINANHIRSVTKGNVLGLAKPIHIGKATQVWNINIYKKDKITCSTRLTMANLKRVVPSY